MPSDPPLTPVAVRIQDERGQRAQCLRQVLQAGGGMERVGGRHFPLTISCRKDKHERSVHGHG